MAFQHLPLHDLQVSWYLATAVLPPTVLVAAEESEVAIGPRKTASPTEMQVRKVVLTGRSVFLKSGQVYDRRLRCFWVTGYLSQFENQSYLCCWSCVGFTAFCWPPRPAAL